MKIGVLTVQDRDFHPNRRLSEAAEQLGHSLVLINPYRLAAGIVSTNFFIHIDGQSGLPDVVLPRQGALMGDYGLAVIRQFEQMGIPLINGHEGVAISRNQYLTLQKVAGMGIKVPRTVFLTGLKMLHHALTKLGGYPVVLKQVNGMGGDGVIKAENPDSAEAFLDRHLPEKKGVVAQRFIPPENRRDIRLFIIGQRVAGAMELIPAPGSFKANIHQQGKSRAFVPDQDLKEMAVKSAQACYLDIAGVDLIIEENNTASVIEVNYSPGFRGIEAATGIDIAAQVIEFAAAKYIKGENKYENISSGPVRK